MLIPTPEDLPSKRSFSHSQYLLRLTITNLFLHHPVCHVLFITLTFSRFVFNPQEAHRRLNSFMNKVRKRNPSYIWVLGCHDNGGLHYHLLVNVDFDSLTGTNLTTWSSPLNDDPRKRDQEQRNAMNPALRSESDWWTTTARRYGFGRVEVAPIYSTPEAIRKYLLKQAPAACRGALANRRNTRFWACSRDLKSGTTNFSWNTDGAKLHRQRLREWGAERGCASYEELRQKLGPKWGYQFHCDMLREQNELSSLS